MSLFRHYRDGCPHDRVEDVDEHVDDGEFLTEHAPLEFHQLQDNRVHYQVQLIVQNDHLQI
ncbi:MAG: hypothetical protein GY776_07755 [Alteromonas sp.]|nr:hypothetical protein [Alteromonas sp.]